ncbi:Predicted pyrophosphatase or phosphodiesterase, AlkP superfamily [Arthrobacter subterraneus]|uniref:Predicted pyrophosphatase or phosphodiesterase, AlkP superfamily n=1 Tax=Arthrobacter subterraneus TaxID=335973 RepID=A0A1G8H9Y1_9MICC|nr:nucleotide pyrophosphatase/phosphodiesterase family protein [Arthrobacter subterraneus]SDI03300.1 Predicted pyrophosphatase or phosphodiesterase, AlkP superfamily [Arthrobacter subterraneus]
MNNTSSSVNGPLSVNQEATRRQILRWGAMGGAAVILSGAPGAAWAKPKGPQERVRAYVLVVDGCRPDEITPALTPRLAALRGSGTTYPAARSLPVMETIPNHVMMMTGARPDRTGVPANKIYDRAEGVQRDLDRPTDLRFPTIIERLNQAGRTTGTVLSKEYLYGIFGERATYRWEPAPIVPVSGHAPDAATMDAIIAMVDAADPDLVFTNLGDVDRMGHSDLSGTTLQAARTAALASTDRQVGRFIDHLTATGKWDTSVLLVLADHSMDWSIPTNVISVDLILREREDLRSQVVIAQNGGADLLYWTGPAASRDSGLAEVSSLVAAHPGVLAVADPSSLRLGPEAGDLIATCRAGWRFSDPYVVSNPIPGNHGHPATEPIPFFISGGSPRVRAGVVSSEQARTIDVAPTLGFLFGMNAPAGGYDGTARSSAFTG